jgi:hypothetical protein
MNIDPRRLSAALSPALRRQIVDDVATVLAENLVKSELIKPTHLSRRAVVYIRQSTPHQVVNNQESLRLQYALRQRAYELGWHEADIDVIDADLGLSGASTRNGTGLRNSSVESGAARWSRFCRSM